MLKLDRTKPGVKFAVGLGKLIFSVTACMGLLIGFYTALGKLLVYLFGFDDFLALFGPTMLSALGIGASVLISGELREQFTTTLFRAVLALGAVLTVLVAAGAMWAISHSEPAAVFALIAAFPVYLAVLGNYVDYTQSMDEPVKGWIETFKARINHPT